jgi:hypothetical protein
LEAKVAKGKATESALHDSRMAKENAEKELDSFKHRVLREAFANMTKAYYDMYTNGIQVMNKQMAEINGGSMPMMPTSLSDSRR